MGCSPAHERLTRSLALFVLAGLCEIGGIFIAMALLWGWLVDGHAPDRFDLFGGTIALLGMLIIMYAARR